MLLTFIPVAQNNRTPMRDPPRFETREEIDCPRCGKDIPLRADVCPHCEAGLH